MATKRRMSLSFRRAIDLLEEQGGDLDLNDLGFLLTVLRDDAVQDKTWEVLQDFTEQLWEKTHRSSS
ncbi:hypothetical protein ACSMFR_05550 [Listeria aquatica]|uniref:hypothetical protein n=1 Tax=Listeria aquatica TaxID=1494960 RepID=UPI003F726C65